MDRARTTELELSEPLGGFPEGRRSALEEGCERDPDGLGRPRPRALSRRESPTTVVREPSCGSKCVCHPL